MRAHSPEIEVHRLGEIERNATEERLAMLLGTLTVVEERLRTKGWEPLLAWSV